MSSAFRHCREGRKEGSASSSIWNTSGDHLTRAALTFILSYTAAAFSGLLLWCLKANSVSTVPGEMHYKGGERVPTVRLTCLFADKQAQVWRSAYRSPDVCVGFSELLPYPLSQSRHSVFGGTVEMLVSTWYHPVAPHTGPERRGKFILKAQTNAEYLHTKIFDHRSYMDNNKIFMQDTFFTIVPKSKRGQLGFTHDFTWRPPVSDEVLSCRSVRLLWDRRSACYLLMLMMWPSSTFRSFIDLYASRVQIDRAKTFTCRGEEGQAGWVHYHWFT